MALLHEQNSLHPVLSSITLAFIFKQISMLPGFQNLLHKHPDFSFTSCVMLCYVSPQLVWIIKAYILCHCHQS